MVPNPIKMDDLGGFPIFLETPKCHHLSMEKSSAKICPVFSLLLWPPTSITEKKNERHHDGSFWTNGIYTYMNGWCFMVNVGKSTGRPIPEICCDFVIWGCPRCWNLWPSKAISKSWAELPTWNPRCMAPNRGTIRWRECMVTPCNPPKFLSK